MARRKSKELPFHFPKAGASTGKPLAVLPISDSTRLLLERFLSAQDAVIAHAQAAAEAFVRTVMRLDQVDPDQGWKFNRAKMRWEKHPVQTDA